MLSDFSQRLTTDQTKDWDKNENNTKANTKTNSIHSAGANMNGMTFHI